MISVVYFDRTNRLLDSNIYYIAGVSAVFFIIYLAADYIIKNRHIKQLVNETISKNDAPILPKPQDYKDEVYTDVIQKLYTHYIEGLENTEKEYRENREFMTSWVHEIKTPITTSRLIYQGGSIGKPETASLIEELSKIEDYVEKVLYYTRSDDFSKDYIITEENLSSIVKGSVKKHAMMFISKKINFKDEVSSEITVDTDKKWISFIVDQLISNALKYTHEGGSITIKSQCIDKEKLLIIEDTGVGIKSEDIARLFSPSFTGYNGREENSKATGFGLYLSQKLAQKLGHHITIESEHGRGTRAIIHFPFWNDYYDVTKM
jgi:Signal transduction histidine kinase